MQGRPESGKETDMAEKIKILGFAGSLRKGSYNKVILEEARKSVPPQALMEVYDLEGLPFFNQDLENNPTEKVKEFKLRIREADGILIATPEYNYSIPGVLKNAIDVASRPYGTNAFQGKPVALMGASIGALGTARAQYHLRQCFVFLNMIPMNMPEVMVPFAQDKIDANGQLHDQKTEEKIKELVDAFVAWIRKVQKMG
jgi:chromate reductase, NAD(P)H dehydrogenase (quinone)